jgi:hypothetical protein
MAYEFNPEMLASVRAAIGLDVDTSNLPDEVLLLPVYKTRTERFINESISGLTEAQITEHAEDIDVAAAYYMASLVTPTIRQVTAENIVGGFIRYGEIDLAAHAEALQKEATRMINEVLEDAEVTTPASSVGPFVFTTAKARRNW